MPFSTKVDQFRRSRTYATIAIAVIFSLFASTFAILAPVTAVAAQSADFGTADVTPSDALVYVRINLHPESDQWQLSAELLERSGIPAATGEDFDLEDIQEVEPEIDGEAAFVLTSIDVERPIQLNEVTSMTTDPVESLGGDIPSGFSVLFQPENMDEIEQMIQASLEDEGTSIETSEYGGVTILYAPPADEYSEGYAYAKVNDTTLAIATIPADLEPIIDTANGDTDPLSGNDNFTDMQSQLTTDSLVFGYVDSSALIDQVLAAVPDAEASIPQETLDQARGFIGFTAWADQPGFRFDSLLIPSEGNTAPELSPVSEDLASRVSSDSLFFTTGRDLGATGALDAIGLLAAQAIAGEEPLATPEPTQDAEAYADEIFARAAETIGFNIKTDFIDQLVDDYAFSVSARNLDSGTPEINAIFVSGAADPQTVNGVISKISFMASAAGEEGTVSSRDLADGTSIYQFNIGDATFPIVLEAGVVDGQLLIGINNGIDEYVDGPASALADDANYDAVFSNLPSEYSVAAFVNVPALAPIIESFAMSMNSSSTPDNDPKCGEYATQEEAQAAYDETFDFDLDQDFDGEACEDYFSEATPEASPASISSSLNILGIGMVTYDADGNVAQSAIIAIGE